MLISVLHIIFQNGQKGKQPKLSHQLMNEQNAAFAYNGLLFDDKKEVLIHASIWIKLQNMLSEKKPVAKELVLSDSIYMKGLE